jgi:hypothetical protein
MKKIILLLPIQLVIVAIGGTANSVDLTIGGVAITTNYFTNTSNGRCGLFAIVPPGQTYYLGDASATISRWVELR